jgi:hypothetical protein
MRSFITERDTHTDTPAGRQAGRQAERQICRRREAERQTTGGRQAKKHTVCIFRIWIFLFSNSHHVFIERKQVLKHRDIFASHRGFDCTDFLHVWFSIGDMPPFI